MLDSLREPATLHRETLHFDSGNRAFCSPPLDPIDDSKRGRVGIPPTTKSRRILGNPSEREVLLQLALLRRGGSREVVEVVKVVEPELARRRIVPATRVRDVASFAQERHGGNPEKASIFCNWLDPRARHSSLRRRFAKIDARLNEPKPCASIQLTRSEVTNRVPVLTDRCHGWKSRSCPRILGTNRCEIQIA